MSLDVHVPLYRGERLKNLVLCYAGPWALMPYLHCREDEELLWHSRQGVLLAFAEIFVSIALLIMCLLPIIGLLALHILLPIWLTWCLSMSITSIVQASKGKRHKIPVIGHLLEYV